MPPDEKEVYTIPSAFDKKAGAVQILPTFPSTQRQKEKAMQSRSKRPPVSVLSFIVSVAMLLFAWLPTTVLAAQTTFSCKSVDITTFPERIHVRCSTAASGGIIFFAVPTANNEHAARILSTLLAGHIAGRTLVIGYDPADTSGTAFGCAQNDCRRLLYVGVK